MNPLKLKVYQFENLSEKDYSVSPSGIELKSISVTSNELVKMEILPNHSPAIVSFDSTLEVELKYANSDTVNFTYDEREILKFEQKGLLFIKPMENETTVQINLFLNDFNLEL